MFNRKRNKYKTQSDQELLMQFNESSNSLILGEIYQRYAHLVMGTAMKYLKNKFDAEDLTMSLFEKLPKKLTSHKIDNFKSWLYMVTKNECLMLLRKKKYKSDDITVELQADDDLSFAHIKEEQFNQLEFAIDELKEEQKICIKLFYIESKSYIEISNQLKLDQNKVKSAIQNGKRNLKIKLEGRNEFKSTT